MFELTMHEGHKALDWLEWSATIVKAVAWPLATIVISLIFRSQLRGLLTRLQKLSWGDKEASFAEKLDKVEESTGETSIVLLGDKNQPPPVNDDRFDRLLAISPAAAILDTWQRIERLIDQFNDEDFAYHRVRSLPTKINYLQSIGIVSGSGAERLHQLRNLRNVAAHAEGELTGADAYRFKQLSDQTLADLERALEERHS